MISYAFYVSLGGYGGGISTTFSISGWLWPLLSSFRYLTSSPLNLPFKFCAQDTYDDIFFCILLSNMIEG
jgi:hypothetical protein